MKTFILILTSFLLLNSCFNSSELKSNHQPQLKANQDTLNISGLWVMQDYIDSVLINKSIVKYRMQWPTWFAILIDINEDSIKTYGSINDIELQYNLQDDTLCFFSKNVTGEWMLTFNNNVNRLELRHIKSEYFDIDSNVYIYEKRPQMNFLLDSLLEVHKTRENFIKYFNEKLFSGTYEVISSTTCTNMNEEISFHKNGKVNFNNFTNYEVDVYFGTSHAFKNLDVISFRSNKEGQRVYQHFNWVFKDDTLILRNFIHETTIYQGKEYITDDYILGKERYVLLKKE